MAPDRIVQALTVVVVDARTHTMFGFLFAYGVGQTYARQTARGTSPEAALAAWLLTVVATYRMDRAGMRGPAETLLRRLTYRRAPR